MSERPEATGSRSHPAPGEVVRCHLADAASAWSIGTYGAIGEFLRDADEPAAVAERAGEHSVVTPRGALRVGLPDGVRVIAYETLARRPGGWNQAVAFCLSGPSARVPCRVGLTELGPDGGAARPQDREAILFDLGLGLPHVEACVRTADPALLGELRRHLGRSLLERGNPVIDAIKAGHPHRVFRSRLGRLEVYQPIGSGTAGARTPEGPHTHLLPRLLAEGRTHAADVPLPAGRLPCLMLYPASPVTDPLGEPMPFDRGRHRAFQALMAAYAGAAYMAEKARVRDAVLGAESPAACRAPEGGRRRVALRVALRQLAHTDPGAPALAAWRDTFDGAG